MLKRKYIKIEEPCIQDGKRIVFRLSFPLRVKKYFLSDSFYVEYDKRIDHVDKSILNIPAVTAMTLVAWAIGADIYVKELDETYIESLNRIKSIMKRWYPNFSFSTQINAEKIISNKFSNKGYALLFSGGIDSTVSYIKHRSKKPELISIWGNEILPEQATLWENCRKEIIEFSRKEKIGVHFVKTNIRRFIYENQLSVELGLSWWGRVSHGTTMLSLCAPLTKDEIGTILIGSSGRPQDIKYPWGSTPFVDNKLRWADIKITNDCTELGRQDKIRYVLKEYMKGKKSHLFLRVCNSPTNSLNCSKCEKCLRTIVELVLENIDPNCCGFKVDSDVFKRLKEGFDSHAFKMSENPGTKLFHEAANTLLSWKDIQREIPDQIGHNLYDSKEFFDWFRTFDLTKYGRDLERKIECSKLFTILKIRLFSCISPVWFSFPNKVREVMKKAKRPMSKSKGKDYVRFLTWEEEKA